MLRSAFVLLVVVVAAVMGSRPVLTCNPTDLRCHKNQGRDSDAVSSGFSTVNNAGNEEKEADQFHPRYSQIDHSENDKKRNKGIIGNELFQGHLNYFHNDLGVSKMKVDVKNEVQDKRSDLNNFLDNHRQNHNFIPSMLRYFSNNRKNDVKSPADVGRTEGQQTRKRRSADDDDDEGSKRSDNESNEDKSSSGSEEHRTSKTRGVDYSSADSSSEEARSSHSLPYQTRHETEDYGSNRIGDLNGEIIPRRRVVMSAWRGRNGFDGVTRFAQDNEDNVHDNSGNRRRFISRMMHRLRGQEMDGLRHRSRNDDSSE